MGNTAFNPFDPSQLAAFSRAQVSSANPGPSVPSSDTIGSPQQVSQIPQPSPSAPLGSTASPQDGSQAQSGKGGPVKGYLMKFLEGFGDNILRSYGMPTPFEQHNQEIVNQGRIAQANNENAEAQYKVAQTKSLADTIPVTMENGMTYHLPKALATKILATQSANVGKENVADTRAQAATDVAGIRAKVQDRIAQANIDLRQAIQDRNFEFANKKFSELQKYRQAEIGLQQGRMDMAREALDYRETGPTAQTKTVGQFAGTLTEKIPELKSEIDRLDAEGKLGPLQGRWNDFLAGKVGTGDPDYNNLRVGLSLFASGTARAHTSRTGIEAINYFKSLLAQPGATAAQIKSGLDAAAPYLEGYKKAGQWQNPRSSNAPAPTPTASGNKIDSLLGKYK